MISLPILPSALAAESSDYHLGATYTGDILSVVSGGLHRGSAYLDNLDVTFEADLPAITGPGHGTLFLYGLYNNVTTLAEHYVGDLQVTSNIDAPEALRLFEAWYEFGRGPWSLRSGLYDLNSEFDVTETGSLFLNSSHGIGAEFSQAGENGPSIFPVSSLAIRLQWQFESVSGRVAVLDGVPGHPADPSSNRIDLDSDDGLLLVGELDWPLGNAARAWAGYWSYTSDFQHQVSDSTEHNDGWYLGTERRISIVGYDAAVFLRFGSANPGINPLRNYLGAGVVVDGLIPGRPADQLGLAVASAGLGDAYRAKIAQPGLAVAARETTWELTYRAALNDYLVLQPNLQYVRNPAAQAGVDHAVVAGLRFELSVRH